MTCPWCAREHGRKRQSAPVEERFWRLVERGDGCWLWLGRRQRQGYGEFDLPCDGRGPYLAHRMSYELTHGLRLGEKCLLHSCDNPPCVNPAHLRPGTLADNCRDMWAKGRGRSGCYRGEDSHLATVLNNDLVRAIRAHYAAGGVTQREVAAALGVTLDSVKHVLRGTSWRHVA